MRSSRLLGTACLGLTGLSALTACGASPEVVRSVSARHAAPVAAGPAGLSAPAAAGPGSAALPGGTAPIAAGRPTAAAAGPAGATRQTGSANGSAPVAGACGVAAPAGGNGGSTDTGVTATSIKVGGTFFNGGYLDKYSQVAENGAKAYFDYINDQGGICGRKIKYVTCDTAGTADGTSGCFTKLADQEKVFTMGPSLDFNLDIVEKGLAQRKLPWVGSSGLYDAEFTSPWMYPTQPPGGAVGALITAHSVKKLGAKKLGVSLLRNGAGPSCTAQAKKVAAANGAAVVATAENNEVETSLDNQVSTLKNAGVDTVLFCNDPVNTIKFIQASQRNGWKPRFVGGFVAVPDVPGAAGSSAKGMYGLTMYDFYNSQSPGVQKYRQITEYYYPQTFHHFYEEAAYVGAEAIVAALQATGPKVTRTAFLSHLRSMRSFDSGLGLKLDFSNLGGQTPSGIMIQADSNLAWQVASPRFTPTS
jgi:branched-chain amino acid transport system substrate-binding protein